MRSWKSYVGAAFAYDRLRWHKDFLLVLVRNIHGSVCECSSDCLSEIRCAAALCLDCTGGYSLCERAARRRYPTIPTRDEVSKHLVHNCSPSEDPHEYIFFGCHTSNDGKEGGYYGIRSSISMLEDWYARNSNGVDAALD
jgi:hypothetical protein